MQRYAVHIRTVCVCVCGDEGVSCMYVLTGKEEQNKFTEFSNYSVKKAVK